MSTSNKKNHTIEQSNASHTGDPVAALQQIARKLPAVTPPTTVERKEMNRAEHRAPSALIALVLSMAEEGGGFVAGIPIDVAWSRDALAKATHLRVGAAAARAIARRSDDEAMSLASGVAQTPHSATTSLEALARTPDGRTLAGKAAELRAIARPRKKKGKGATAATPSQPAPSSGANETPQAPAPATAV
jgi:hypothetical protein